MLGMILIVVGGIIAFVGGIWFLVVAFQENILWGLGCILLPIVSLVFHVMHLDKAGKPFLINLVGGLLMFAGIFLGGVPVAD